MGPFGKSVELSSGATTSHFSHTYTWCVKGLSYGWSTYYDAHAAVLTSVFVLFTLTTFSSSTSLIVVGVGVTICCCDPNSSSSNIVVTTNIFS